MPNLPMVTGSRDVPYTRGRDFNLGEFICRVLGQPRHFLACAKAWHLDPPRHYHTFDHALDVAQEVMLAGYDEFIEHPHELFIAALFHDAIYVAGATDNEQKSVQVAVDAMEEFNMDVDGDFVERLIWLTSKHFTDIQLSDEEAIFMDADIHGFAAPWEMFLQHQEDINKEFLATSSHQEVVEKHLKFMQFALDLPHIFYSKRGRAIHESAARANIKRYLDGNQS